LPTYPGYLAEFIRLNLSIPETSSNSNYDMVINAAKNSHAGCCYSSTIAIKAKLSN